MSGPRTRALKGKSPSPPRGPRAAAGYPTERLAYFSDAVVAIAITLLAVDLRVGDLGPGPIESQLEAALSALTGRILAFGLSFVVIAIWWNGHRRLFASLAAADGTLTTLNMAFLGGIAFLPFPTSVLGRFGDQPTAVILYAANISVLGATSWLMSWHARRASLLNAAVDHGAIRRRLVFVALTPAVFLASIPIAVVAPWTAMLSWNAVWIASAGLRVAWRPADRAG